MELPMLSRRRALLVIVSLAAAACCCCWSGAVAQSNNITENLSTEDNHDHYDEHNHHDAHDDHSPGLEWAGIFETPDAEYVWTAQAVNGAYADPAMKMVVLPAAAPTESELLALHAEASHALEGENCIEVEVGGIITPAFDVCYELHFNTSHVGEDKIHPGTPDRMCYDLDSTFRIATEGFDSVAFFAQHVPLEFERSQHYLKTVTGEDLEPAAEWSPSPPKPWGEAIGASIVVLIITLVGVLLLIPAVANAMERFPAAFSVISNSFAAGALLAAAFFLVLYEATHLIPIDETRTEAQASAAWGCMILLGFLTGSLVDLAVCALIQLVFPSSGEHADAVSGHNAIQSSANQSACEGGKPGDKQQASSFLAGCDEKVSAFDKATQRRILGGVLIGDFMHNFCDGIFIGTAFRYCGSATGWTVTAATVYHEIAQEVADYIILTDPKGGALKPVQALLLNFASGTSVVLGVVTILTADISSFATGLILAYGGGVFIQIGATEAMSRVHLWTKNLQLRLLSLLCFTIGAAAIGFVLLDHEHCTVGGGHDHGHGH
mmetsp:Transcript_32916/g.83053  ORF Transcript_32916/g.83053 Transcript_32916/m.83053 type:complete len:550 (-) Transcript_32916:167-1816(-)